VFFIVMISVLGLVTQQARPVDSEARLRGAIQALQQGDFATAEQEFREVLKLDPGSVAAYCDLGVVLARTGKPAAAVESFQKALELTPENPGISLNLGLAYYSEEEFASAIPHLKRVLQLDADQLQARYLLGLADFQLGRYAATVEAFEPILARERNNIVFLYVLAVSYGKLERTQDSIKTFDLFHEVGGEKPLLHLLVGQLFLGMGEIASARGELEKVVAADPTLPYSHLLLGTAYLRLGRLEEAGKEFDLEIVQNPSEPLSYEDRGTVYLLRGPEPDKALDMFERALAINAKMCDSLAGAAKCYLLKGEPALAVAFLERAVELKPRSYRMHYLLARALLKEGKTEEAHKEFANAKKLANAPESDDSERLDSEGLGDGRLPALAAPGPRFRIEHQN
jgi:tetratricopeptide (TPR) repeat protein